MKDVGPVLAHLQEEGEELVFDSGKLSLFVTFATMSLVSLVFNSFPHFVLENNLKRSQAYTKLHCLAM